MNSEKMPENPDQRPPRDWLLDRHAAATPALDALRRDLVTSLQAAEPGWREVIIALFQPYRRAWQALGVVWLVIVLLHFSRAPQPPSAQLPPPAPETLAHWHNQLKANEAFAQIPRRP